MLGLTPQPSLSGKGTSDRASRKLEAESVEEAWGEADMVTESSDDSEAEALVESRYDIESRKQPPKKRRRTSTRANEDITLHTVYTTDEEDGYLAAAGRQPHDDAYGITEEEDEYAVSALDGADQERGGGKAEKRSYWLSKAMAGAGGDSDD